MSIALASVAVATLTAMDMREIRRERLLQLIGEQKGAGKQRTLAGLIGKAPAQVSQWVNRTRTITEDTARQIEAKLKKPKGWLDHEPGAPAVTGAYDVAPHAAREHMQPSLTPPPPPRDFHDRRLVSESDWAILQDVKTAATPEELAAIRERAEMIERKVAERLAEVGAAAGSAPTNRNKRRR